MPIKTRAASLIALAAVLAFGFGCAAEDEITDAANKAEAGPLQDKLDAVVDGGARGALLLVDDPNSDPIELSAGTTGVQAEVSMEEATSMLEEDESLVAQGEDACGEWDGYDGSVRSYLVQARLTETGRRVVLVVDPTRQDETVKAPEAQAAIGELVESALCR